jgi:hypothetical protein
MRLVSSLSCRPAWGSRGRSKYLQDQHNGPVRSGAPILTGCGLHFNRTIRDCHRTCAKNGRFAIRRRFPTVALRLRRLASSGLTSPPERPQSRGQSSPDHSIQFNVIFDKTPKLQCSELWRTTKTTGFNSVEILN